MTIEQLRELLKNISLPEKLRTLGLPDTEATMTFLSSLTARNTVGDRKPRMLECQARERHQIRSSYSPPTGRSYGPHVPLPEEGFTSEHTTAFPPELLQGTAPESTPRGPAASAVTDNNGKKLCQERLETISPEVERVRAAVRAAVEAKRTTKEALDRKQERLRLEMRQTWDSFDQKQVLKLEREEKDILDAEEKVRGLGEDYRKYHNREVAAEARLRQSSNHFFNDARPSAAPVSPAFPDTLKADPSYLQGMNTEVSEHRKLRESYPHLSVKAFADFKFYLKAKREAAKRCEGVNRPGRGWLAQGSVRCEDPPRDGKCDRSRGERRHRRKDSRERRPPARPSAGPRWEENSDSFCSSSDFSRRDNRRRSHRRERENIRDSSSESASPARPTAPIQPSASPLQRSQHFALPSVYHPVPSEPASKNSSTRLPGVSSRPNQGEDVSRKCYASVDTKGLMKLTTIPFDIADGNFQMKPVNFTVSLKEAVT